MSRLVALADWHPSDGIVLEDGARDVAVSTTNKSVIAGPGAGKTELLAQRALFLLQCGVCKYPQRILAISFKRDAAKNLKDRISQRCAPELARRFDSYTFDAFSKSLLDRFLSLVPDWCRPPRDYRIVFPKKNDWEDFIRGLTPPATIGTVFDVRALKYDRIEKWGPLPGEDSPPQDVLAWTAKEWWRQNLQAAQPGVTFPMIGRLAEAILRHNPNVLNALRQTYSYVFLDEFQDTTKAQYSLVQLAFRGSSAVLTAVGDTKQRIMTWAGAEAEVFGWYEEQFGAERKRLQMNHRSNARIVQIINDLVSEIEPDAVETLCARANDPVPPDAAEFWIFKTDEEEAEELARFIEQDVADNAEEGRTVDDFLLLVRQKADEIEKQFRAPFQARGLRLRNEARAIAGIAIQDLMTDDLVVALLGLMRLAVGVRSQEVYGNVQDIMATLQGTDFENPSNVKKLDATVRSLMGSIREFTALMPSEVDFDELVSEIVAETGIQRWKRHYKQYENDAHFRGLQKSLALLLKENAENFDDWQELLDAVEGHGQVRLMTIHKSKGLEYHTVIFVGLHENAFWGYRNNQAEETNAFFVALSRARERVYFTRSVESGNVAQIRGLIQLLEKADIPFVRKYEIRGQEQ